MTVMNCVGAIGYIILWVCLLYAFYAGLLPKSLAQWRTNWRGTLTVVCLHVVPPLMAYLYLMRGH